MTDYDLILSGEPAAATAAAKRLISTEAVDAARLRDIAIEKKNPDAARIVALYALGFTDDGSVASGTLAGVAADDNDSEGCRRHAAAALTRLHAPGVVKLLSELLEHGEPEPVQRWCVHALGDMDGTQARNVLLKFARANPAGEVVDELRTALARQWFRARELGAALRDILHRARPQ
ncbi:MAG TPA: HEAT repeat domain-containing protein [Stellaceae bacterium]|nr:HEAT repeat domain-containing protein [Stellaceae bacterium]